MSALTNTRVNPAVVARQYGGLALALAAAVGLNAALWACFVLPQRAKVDAWLEAKRMAESKPKLEALLTQSRALLQDGQQVQFTRQDPAVVMQTLQRLAGTHRVQVTQLQTEGQDGRSPKEERALAGLTSMPLRLQLAGSFSKLARWISAVESQPEFQIESLTLAPSESDSSSRSVNCTLSVTAYLRES